MEANEYIGIDHVQLAAPAGCEKEARAFYRELLGMREIPKPEPLQARGGVWFSCGPHEVHIGVQTDFAPASKAHPAFQVKDIGKLKQALSEKGIVIQEDVPLEGVLRFHCLDPFGNRLEFVQRLT
ncbi:VOC family protein [Paenibacillus sp. MZ04-78.2]|uniref:VOC family protein n=1 Tax=Paenibacillus sp. MZ04-78.2 TaxID=2962034 RepID=UPI0020B807E8|nr:VOC family protein [Paenibacillus sp. MZ04-78.2]MCP3774992.1 VOC family protein [Paenibacillus sp. MZ04-78.2]